MITFAVMAFALIIIAVLLVVVPWYFASKQQQSEGLSNATVVRQRLGELSSEQQQGLIAAEDLKQAENELKVALVEEQAGQIQRKPVSTSLAWLFFVVAMLATGLIYYHSSHLPQLHAMQEAEQRLPELSQRIVVDGDQSITAQDIQDFALGVRMRLQEQPNDATGWMLLGRLHVALRQTEQASQAFERSLAIKPDNLGALASYSQILLMTGQEENMRKAKVLLQRQLQLNPDDDNATLMLTLAASELGDIDLARQQFAKLEGKLSPSDPLYQSLSERLQVKNLAQGSAEQQVGKTGFVINIELDESLKDKLPADGYLFVFAQDAQSGMRMPAAVVRQPLSSLPLTVRLSDDNAMTPEFKLSQLKQTRLVARISKDGNVTETTGALQGETLATVQQGLAVEQQITIDKEIL